MSTSLKVYANYCGPRAYSRLVGVSRLEAARDLMHTHLALGLPAPRQSTDDEAMVRALKDRGFKVRTSFPRRPPSEAFFHVRPVTDRMDVYYEARWTLAQWLKRQAGTAGVCLVIVGTQNRSHYVVVEDGVPTVGVYGSYIMRRRVVMVHEIRRPE